MNEIRNINDLISDWAQRKQYSIGWNEKGGNIQNIMRDYEHVLCDMHIDTYDDMLDFWSICELYISLNLSLEWQYPKYGHAISKAIINKLKDAGETNGIIQVLKKDITYAYVEKSMVYNGYEINFLKSISNSTLNTKKRIEIINIGAIIKDFLWSDIIALFWILQQYKKPDQSFEFIHIHELDKTVVDNTIELLKKHAEKYNLGEVYAEEMLVNLEQFMNNLWNSSFNSYAR